MSYIYTFASVGTGLIAIVPTTLETWMRIAVGCGSLIVGFFTVKYHRKKIKETELSIEERELRIKNLKSNTP